MLFEQLPRHFSMVEEKKNNKQTKQTQRNFFPSYANKTSVLLNTNASLILSRT